MTEKPAKPRPATKPSTKLPSGLELYQIYIEYIRHENELIHQRNTWFLATQGVLLAGLAVFIQNGFDSFISALRFLTFDSTLGATKYMLVWYSCCAAGLLTSQQANRALKGAWRSQSAIETLWEKQEAELRNILPDLKGGKNAPKPHQKAPGLASGMSQMGIRFWWIALSLPIGALVIRLGYRIIAPSHP